MKESLMDENQLKERARRDKMWMAVATGLFVFILAAVLLCFGLYIYRHTFTVEKWNADKESRNKIVADMLDQYPLVGMSEAEIIALLGDEDSQQSSFKITREHFPPETTLVYYLGVDYMDNCWLIISLEDGIAVSYCIDVT